jgi:ATP-binding cassette subfamily C protein LapB
VGWVLQHRLHELSETTYQAGAQRNATLVESLSGIETIKTQGAESVMQARWERQPFLAHTGVKMRGCRPGQLPDRNFLTQLVTVSHRHRSAST